MTSDKLLAALLKLPGFLTISTIKMGKDLSEYDKRNGFSVKIHTGLTSRNYFQEFLGEHPEVSSELILLSSSIKKHDSPEIFIFDRYYIKSHPSICVVIVQTNAKYC